MKNSVLCLAACLLLLTSCEKTVEALIEKGISSSTSTSTDFIKYTIPKGQHNVNNNVYKPVETNELKFIVRFDSTAIYTSVSDENQYDINKLYGFSDNGDTHHNFSARFGWSWTNGKLWLYAYTYNNAKRFSKELTAITIGQEAACSIKITGPTYQFFVNGTLLAEMSRAAATPKGKGYMLYPYFGGDEKAPHDVNIWIKNL